MMIRSRMRMQRRTRSTQKFSGMRTHTRLGILRVLVYHIRISICETIAKCMSCIVQQNYPHLLQFFPPKKCLPELCEQTCLNYMTVGKDNERFDSSQNVKIFVVSLVVKKEVTPTAATKVHITFYHFTELVGWSPVVDVFVERLCPHSWIP